MKKALVNDQSEPAPKGVDKIKVKVIGPSGRGKSILANDLKMFLREHPLAEGAEIVIKEIQTKQKS